MLKKRPTAKTAKSPKHWSKVKTYEELKAIANGKPNAPHPPGLMPVAYVADQIARLINHPRRRVVIPYSWNILVFIATQFPGLADSVIRFFIDRENKKK